MDQPFALSLSGGGLSAIAYAGFIDVLKEHKLEPAMYAGLSGGAILAVLLASGFTTQDVVAFIDHLKTWKILNTHPTHLEILDHRKLAELFRNFIPYETFEELPKPAAVFASDLVKNEPVLLNTGDIASAVIASCSIFPLIQPVRRHGLVLGDGGSTVYYGAKYLRDMGMKKIIGVDVTGMTEGRIGGLFRALFQQINSTISSNARYELNRWPVDLSIQITFPAPDIFSLDKKANHLISVGQKYAKKNMNKIHRLLTPEG